MAAPALNHSVVALAAAKAAEKVANQFDEELTQLTCSCDRNERRNSETQAQVSQLKVAQKTIKDDVREIKNLLWDWLPEIKKHITSTPTPSLSVPSAARRRRQSKSRSRKGNPKSKQLQLQKLWPSKAKARARWTRARHTSAKWRRTLSLIQWRVSLGGVQDLMVLQVACPWTLYRPPLGHVSGLCARQPHRLINSSAHAIVWPEHFCTASSHVGGFMYGSDCSGRALGPTMQRFKLETS